MSDVSEELNSAPPPAWWGEYDLSEGQTGFWQLGPLSLWIGDRDHEWRLAFERGADPLDPGVVVTCPVEGDPVVPETAERARMATHRTAGTLRLAPALADREVVSRPEIPFQLLPNDHVDLYVSTPLWLRVLAGEDHAYCLWDQPLFRPSDTWIGPDTTRGSLAYASRTFMRLDPTNVPYYPGRAVTRIRLENRAPSTLSLERLSLPVRGLSVWADGAGRLVTEAVTLTREPDGELAAVRIEHGTGPEEAAGAAPLSGPRDVPKRGGIIRALSSLLG